LRIYFTEKYFKMHVTSKSQIPELVREHRWGPTFLLTDVSSAEILRRHRLQWPQVDGGEVKDVSKFPPRAVFSNAEASKQLNETHQARRTGWPWMRTPVFNQCDFCLKATAWLAGRQQIDSATTLPT
jgi:hypothetical protein